MCTVTFLPNGANGFVLTSNRDEAPNRQTIPPRVYREGKTNMLFPKDERAGGTWIGLSDKQRLVCLLNGGFTLHARKAEYRMSRGVVVKQILVSDNTVALINEYDFHNIEPFTLILIEWQTELTLFELVWDGKEKHFSSLPLEPKLWSSSTLYDTTMKEDRQLWFADFLEDQELSAESLMEFHKTAGFENEDFGVVMNRGFVKTTSITQIIRSEHGVSMNYQDLESNEVTKVDFKISEIINE